MSQLTHRARVPLAILAIVLALGAYLSLGTPRAGRAPDQVTLVAAVEPTAVKIVTVATVEESSPVASTPTATPTPEVAPTTVVQAVRAVSVPTEAPASIPAPIVNSVPGRYVSISSFMAAANAVGWSDPYVRVVATCEAGVDLDRDGVKESIDLFATGGQGERGPLQVHPTNANGIVARLGFTWGQMYELIPNLTVGLAMYRAAGWGPWSCA